MDNQQILCQIYQTLILPQFDLNPDLVKWGKSIDLLPDSSAHFFETVGSRYVLIFEDYPGNYAELSDIGSALDLKEDLVYVYPGDHTPTKGEKELPLTFPTPSKHIDNLTGYFTLVKIG